MSCCSQFVLTYVESHPRDRLILWNLGPLDHFQGQSLIVELESENGTWRGPCSYHQVVKHCTSMGSGKAAFFGDWCLEIQRTQVSTLQSPEHEKRVLYKIDQKIELLLWRD